MPISNLALSGILVRRKLVERLMGLTAPDGSRTCKAGGSLGCRDFPEAPTASVCRIMGVVRGMGVACGRREEAWGPSPQVISIAPQYDLDLSNNEARPPARPQEGCTHDCMFVQRTHPPARRPGSSHRCPTPADVPERSFSTLRRIRYRSWRDRWRLWAEYEGFRGVVPDVLRLG